MLKLEEQIELSLDILSYQKNNFNLYVEFPNKIQTANELADISSFLEPYLIKHNINYFEFDLSNGVFKIINTHLPNLLKYIKNLSAINFEKISALICKCFGFDSYFITRQSHDQGVDIIAYSNHFKTFFDLSSNYKYFIFGQCKKKKQSVVETKEIRELCGSIELFKNREFAVKNPTKIYSDYNIKMYSPVHAIFTSGYFFSDNAITLCINSEIIPLDVLDVVFILLKNLNQQKLNCIKKNGGLNKNKIKRLVMEVEVEY